LADVSNAFINWASFFINTEISFDLTFNTFQSVTIAGTTWNLIDTDALQDRASTVVSTFNSLLAFRTKWCFDWITRSLNAFELAWAATVSSSYNTGGLFTLTLSAFKFFNDWTFEGLIFGRTGEAR
jgi:hypothetical protein